MAPFTDMLLLTEQEKLRRSDMYSPATGAMSVAGTLQPEQGKLRRSDMYSPATGAMSVAGYVKFDTLTYLKIYL
jgi:hypothetical protein